MPGMARPELVEIVSRYEPWQDQRHFVKPGLTGLWQISSRGEGMMHLHVDIDLEYIEAVSGRDFLAAVAHSAGRNSRTVHAIERLRQDARRRCFADAAGSDEQIGVRETILLDRILQRSRDMRLPDEIVKSLGTIFSGKDLVTHRLNLIRPNAGENRNPRTGGLKPRI